MTSRPLPLRRLAVGLIAACAGLVSLIIARPTLAGDAPAAGTMAPAFRLPDQAGNPHQLSDYRGQWVVLYFYPKDDTPGCTTQACTFRDDIFAFRRAGAVILGVSVDNVDSHREFAKKHGLPFTLLADADKKTAKAYGVLRNYLAFEIASRQTFLIDPQGRIAVHYPEADPKEGSKLVLADIERLKAAGKKG